MRGKGKAVDYYCLTPARILEESYTFCSRLFLVRFAEELIELQDLCQFRTELDIFPDQLHYPLFIDLELLFSDITSIGQAELFTESDVYFPFLYK